MPTDPGLNETLHLSASGCLGSVSHGPGSQTVVSLVTHVEAAILQPSDRLEIWIPSPLGKNTVANHRFLDDFAEFASQFIIHLIPIALKSFGIGFLFNCPGSRNQECENHFHFIELIWVYTVYEEQQIPAEFL